MLYLMVLLCLLFPSCHRKEDQPSKTITLLLQNDIPSQDPRLTCLVRDFSVLVHTHEGLMRTGADHVPHPALASDITLSPDERTYTFPRFIDILQQARTSSQSERPALYQQLHHYLTEYSPICPLYHDCFSSFHSPTLHDVIISGGGVADLTHARKIS